MAATSTLLLGGCTPAPPLRMEVAPRLSWPTLLGDVRRAGYATSAAPQDSPRIAWTAGVGRGLLAPPLLAPPMVATGTSNRLLAAFDTESGRRYWERHIDGAVGSAVVAGGGRLFAVSEEREGVVYAVEPQRGRVSWRRETGYAAGAPLLVGDTVVVALDDGRVVALRAEDGAVAWRARLPAPAAATPTPFRDLVAVPARNDSVYTLRLADGAVLARTRMGGFLSATPALAGDTLLLPLESGGLVALRLPALERIFALQLPDSASPPPPVLAAPVVAPDGTVYLLQSSGTIWKLAPGSARPEPLVRLGRAARGSLTLTRDGLVVGSLDGVLALVRFDGSTAWSLRLDGSIVAPAAVLDGAAYVPLERGRIVKVQ